MDEQAFRAEVRAALGARLQERRADAGFSFLGAGQDDVEAGRDLLAALADGGWAVPTWPGRWGGRDATAEQAAIIAAELARFDVPDLYPFMVGLALVGPTLLAHGTDLQQARWLPAIASGAEIWCQLFSEPDAGSDLAALSCRAVRDGDVWRITGQKVWSSRAHYSRWGLLLARTDPDVPKHAGITAFGLRMDA
ncbi:MAG TPA: acyl-CoA dehydrogenase family protein, partial [Acidimicrobiales bacterium]|nr:acyl-CoA dehydrogenase family protein [Acidimicrobiales bacterium]